MRLSAYCSRQLGLGLILLALATNAGAKEPLVGHWRAIDKSNGEIQSIIELFLNDDGLHGKILAVLTRDGEKLDPVCTRCEGALKDAKVVGAVFITGLRKEGGRWVGGRVVDLRPGPTQGVVANCELELVDGKAKLVGYLWFRFMSGTDYWQRVPATPTPAPDK